VRLKTLTLHNFKGIKELTIDLDGKNVAIFGDNATGKTTIADAFHWLMSDKNSAGQAQFDIKTLDENGQAIHGLEHSVEAVFTTNDNLTLKKIYKEKWVKAKGSPEAVFSGHETEYFVNGVPVKKSEYASLVSGVVNDEVFKMLSSPAYFNEKMHWKDRRDTLFAVASDANISDAEVISSNPALAKLSEIIGKRNLEDHKKIVASRLSLLNKELEKLPVRIDEVTRSMADETGINVKEYTEAIKNFETLIVQKKAFLNLIESDGKVAIQKDIAEQESKMTNFCTKLQQEYNDTTAVIQKELTELGQQLNNKKVGLHGIDAQIARLEKDIAVIAPEIDKLRTLFAEEDAKTFVSEMSDTCPTCKQSLPAQQVEDARKKALETFNKLKSETLENIRTNGKALAKDKEEGGATLFQLVEAKSVASKEIRNLEADIECLRLKLPKQVNPVENEEYRKMLIQLDELKKSLNTPDENSAKKDEIRASISQVESDIKESKNKLNIVDSNAKARARIEELKVEQEKLADEHRQCSEEAYLCDEFTKAKANMTNEIINSKFKLAKFNMFEVQVNGGINEICECAYEGVPYASLNNAMKINIGCDVINTLSKHYRIEVPVFVDNAESVTDVYKLDTQMVRLVVSEQDKKLRIEL